MVVQGAEQRLITLVAALQFFPQASLLQSKAAPNHVCQQRHMFYLDRMLIVRLSDLVN